MGPTGILQVCNTYFVTDQYLSSCISLPSPFFWHSLEHPLQLPHRRSKSDSYSTAFCARLQAPRLVHCNVGFSSKWMASAVLRTFAFVTMDPRLVYKLCRDKRYKLSLKLQTGGSLQISRDVL